MGQGHLCFETPMTLQCRYSGDQLILASLCIVDKLCEKILFSINSILPLYKQGSKLVQGSNVPVYNTYLWDFLRAVRMVMPCRSGQWKVSRSFPGGSLWVILRKAVLCEPYHPPPPAFSWLRAWHTTQGSRNQLANRRTKWHQNGKHIQNGKTGSS